MRPSNLSAVAFALLALSTACSSPADDPGASSAALETAGAGGAAGAGGMAAAGMAAAGAAGQAQAGHPGSAGSNQGAAGFDHGAAGCGVPGECFPGQSRQCMTTASVPGTQACAFGSSGGVWGDCVPTKGTGGAGGSAATSCPAANAWDVCALSSGQGAHECVADASGVLTWSACAPAKGSCVLGNTVACSTPPGVMPMISGTDVCALGADGLTHWLPGCATPIVLSFDRAPIEFTAANGSFDLAGVGATVPTAWVAARTPWLARDRNGNGSIDDGSELFGSMTTLVGGARARDGFEALAELDRDGDGRITAADPAWSELVLWADENQDRVHQRGETRSLDAAGIIAIELAHGGTIRCVGPSCEGPRSVFHFRDAEGGTHTGDAIDLYFAPIR